MKSLTYLIVLILFNSVILSGQINNPKNLAFGWDTDTLKSEIPLDELTLVLPRYSFSTIDFPNFLSKKEGLSSFYKYEPVISIEINGSAKAYPLNMLTMHEMSNDSLEGVAILPTYCPLCNSSIVFNRKVKTLDGEEQILDFEVSGLLRHSDMVMGDKQSSTLWQQLTGKGIVGKNAGVQLEILPSQVISVSEFFARYPEGKILSPRTNTKSEKHYGSNPYVGYDNNEGKPYQRFFDHEKLDQRLPPMERILNIQSVYGSKVYPYSELKKSGVVNDHFEGMDLVIFYNEKSVSILDKKAINESRFIGSATAFLADLEGEKLEFFEENSIFKDKESSSSWDITGFCVEGLHKGKQLNKLVHSTHFAFAWLNFYPKSIIYQQD